jgi:hypothetical protein
MRHRFAKAEEKTEAIMGKAGHLGNECMRKVFLIRKRILLWSSPRPIIGSRMADLNKLLKLGESRRHFGAVTIVCDRLL